MTETWDPADYYEHSYPQYALALGLLERLRLTGNERILDVGCGDGKVTAELATRVPRGSVLGIDASTDMIGFARMMFPQSAHPNLSFRYGDAAKLTFRNEFDVVVAFASLHWVKDLPIAVRGIKQSLTPGGRFAAQIVAKRHATAPIRSPLHLARKEVMDRPTWRTYFDGFEQHRAYTADECEQLLTDAGFVLRRFKFVNEEVMHRDADALKGTHDRRGIDTPTRFLRRSATPFLTRSYSGASSCHPQIEAGRYACARTCSKSRQRPEPHNRLWNAISTSQHTTCRGAASQDPQFPT